MIIAGAGGHGLEVFQLLLSKGYDSENILFFDEDPSKKNKLISGRPVVTTWDQLKVEIDLDPNFCLGVGNPFDRKKLTEQIENFGGKFNALTGVYVESSIKNSSFFDQMSYSFVGLEAKIGKGVLVNTRANVHHECEVGDYSEIGPSSLLLGRVKIGDMCRIGAGAIILPGVKLGDKVVVGAGAVVTKDQDSCRVVKGIPAK